MTTHRLGQGRGLALAMTLALFGTALFLAPASGEEPPVAAAARGGAEWYGSVEWSGAGSVNVSDGVYQGHDHHVARAVTTGDKTVITSTIDSTMTRPDPDPTQDGCWTKKETWTGGGTSQAVMVVHDGTGRYQISVDATTSIAVQHSVYFGGTIGGDQCSAGDYVEPTSFSPWVRVNSAKNNDPSFRAGAHKTASLEGSGSCTGGPVECTEPLTFLHFPPTSSKWSVTVKPCTGYASSHRLGDGDTAFVFKACQTKSLSSRTSFLHEFSGVPRVCDFVFAGRLSQACTGYKAIVATQWAQNDWFMFNAANRDACGVWVVDKASWRPPKIRPAVGTDNIDVAWISPGTSVNIKSANGSVRVSCPTG